MDSLNPIEPSALIKLSLLIIFNLLFGVMDLSMKNKRVLRMAFSIEERCSMPQTKSIYISIAYIMMAMRRFLVCFF